MSTEPSTSGVAPDEAALLERLRAGDDAAYEELVRSYGGRLLAVARRFLRTCSCTAVVLPCSRKQLVALPCAAPVDGHRHQGHVVKRIVVM